MFERAIAVHEAGHAVAVWSAGFELIEVSIEPGIDDNGHVSFVRPRNARLELADRCRLFEHGELQSLIISAAGPAAQHLAEPETATVGSRSDLDEMHRSAVLLSRTPQAERVLMEWAALEAAALVRNRWSPIVALADALVEHGTLGGVEAIAIIKAADHREDCHARTASAPPPRLRIGHDGGAAISPAARPEASSRIAADVETRAPEAGALRLASRCRSHGGRQHLAPPESTLNLESANP